MAHNTSLGQAAGISHEQTVEIGTGDYLESDLFSDREKMAILWAEHVTLNSAKEDNGVFEKVKEVFSEEEIIELTLMSGFFNMFNRVTDSLHIPVEDQTEVDKIKRSVDLDPDKVLSYFNTLVKDWPENIPGPNKIDG